MAATNNDLTGEVFGSGTITDAAKNLISQIGDLHEESKKQHHLDLAIPGYNELLWARFRPFPVAKTEAKTEQFRRAIERGRPIMLAAACDTIVDSCEQCMVLPAKFEGDIGEDGKNLVPIDDTIAVAFEKRLADLFIKDKTYVDRIKSAREVVLAMFPTEQAIIQMNVEISNWMTDVTRKVNTELVGE